jgi:CBS domain-containing protein/PII-like signaling protein
MRTWQVDDVMTADVVTVRPDAPYREIVDTLANHRVSAAPVVDPDQRVVGVVSEADLLHRIEFVGDDRRVFASRRRRTAHAKAHGATAKDLMSKPAITITSGAPLTAAAKIMDGERVKRLPVVDTAGRLRGIVSRSDLLRVYLRPDHEIERDVVDEVLRRTLWVEPGMVEVEVDQGLVTLTGRTDRHSTRQLAVKLTQAVPGVVEVVDRLEFEFDDRELAGARPYGPSPFGMP